VNDNLQVSLNNDRNQKRSERHMNKSSGKYERHLIEDDWSPANSELNAAATISTDYNQLAAAAAGTRLHLTASQHHV